MAVFILETIRPLHDNSISGTRLWLHSPAGSFVQYNLQKNTMAILNKHNHMHPAHPNDTITVA